MFICRQKQTSLCWTAASLMMLDISHNYYQKISSNIPSNRLNIPHHQDNSSDDSIDKSRASVHTEMLICDDFRRTIETTNKSECNDEIMQNNVFQLS